MTIPRRANTNPMRALSEARRMSIASVIVMPDADRRAVDGGDDGLLAFEDAQRELPAAVAVIGDIGRAAAGGGVERVRATGEVGAGAKAAATAR